MKKKWVKTFTNYVNDFDMNDKDIIRKYCHSLRVMDIAEFIAKKEKFSEKDVKLSALIGLLHDYARFTQWKDYKTYNDKDSIDHGDLAVELLFKNNAIENFYNNKEDYDEIYDAIKYHNKISIKENLSIHNNELCKLIRDADKLDIFYLFITNKKLFEEDNAEIDNDIKEVFYMNKQIDFHNIKSKNDKIVLDFALVFDINFPSSFKYIKENKLIEKMYENLSNKERFKEYYEYIINYINERID